MRDHRPLTPELADRLAASRDTVTDLAGRFADRGIRATWATVGLLMASTAEEAARFRPPRRAPYRDARLDPYAEPLGPDEAADPTHLAGDLVGELAAVPGQEIASHTFSHFYCLEEGPGPEDLAADLVAARAIAAARGLRVRSLVLPRNQWRPDLAPVVRAAGFDCYRGPQPGWATRARSADDGRLAVRALRLVDTYGGPAVPTFAWSELAEPSGLCNVAASAFFRPVTPATRRLEPLRHRRLVAALRRAAAGGRVLHLWWHPHNFTAWPAQNTAALERVLDEAARLGETDGLRSLSMGDVADLVAAGVAA
jgi:peptidoglycan/xylan/chitin deacetylase (PgdA/CDA1 family)